MSLPANVSVVTVKGHVWDDDGSGAPRKVTATPAVSHVTSVSGHGVIVLAEKTATPSDADPYWEIDLVASNDPDLTPVCPWTFRFAGFDGSWTVSVPHDAALVNGRREVWLTALSQLVTPPTINASYYTRSEVDAQFGVFDVDLSSLEARVAALESGHSQPGVTP